MASTDYEYIGQKLFSDTETTDIVDDRIYHGSVPETDTTYPNVSYFLVSRPNIVQGNAERPRYQINCRAKDPGDAQDLAHIVHGVFNNRTETIGGFGMNNTYFEDSRFIPEPDGVFNCVVDIFLQYVNY